MAIVSNSHVISEHQAMLEQTLEGRYYKSLDSGKINRAELFLENNGGYDTVVGKVYENLKQPDAATVAQGVVGAVSQLDSKASLRFAEGQPDGEASTTEEKVTAIKRKGQALEDTARFLEALEEGRDAL